MWLCLAYQCDQTTAVCIEAYFCKFSTGSNKAYYCAGRASLGLSIHSRNMETQETNGESVLDSEDRSLQHRPLHGMQQEEAVHSDTEKRNEEASKEGNRLQRSRTQRLANEDLRSDFENQTDVSSTSLGQNTADSNGTENGTLRNESNIITPLKDAETNETQSLVARLNILEAAARERYLATTLAISNEENLDDRDAISHQLHPYLKMQAKGAHLVNGNEVSLSQNADNLAKLTRMIRTGQFNTTRTANFTANQTAELKAQLLSKLEFLKLKAAESDGTQVKAVTNTTKAQVAVHAEDTRVLLKARLRATDVFKKSDQSSGGTNIAQVTASLLTGPKKFSKYSNTEHRASRSRGLDIVINHHDPNLSDDMMETWFKFLQNRKVYQPLIVLYTHGVDQLACLRIQWRDFRRSAKLRICYGLEIPCLHQGNCSQVTKRYQTLLYPLLIT